jgi:menaquinone-dependent protoporphyrinogen oxidase
LNAIVVYGTRWGGTEKVAQTISKALFDEGFTVEVRDAKKAPTNVEGYDLVVIGSGLSSDRWTKDSVGFIERNVSSLKNKKMALFVSCSMADRKDEGYNVGKKRYLTDTAAKYGLSPISIGYFGCLMDFSYSHGLIVDIIVRVNRRNLRKNGLDTAKVHDTRDWAAIEAWGHEVAKLAQN